MYYRAGGTISEFPHAPLRSIYAFLRGFRERQKDQWRHTLTLYCLQYNSGLSKKDQSRRLDPESLLRKMFDGETAPSQDVLTQKLLNLVAMTGGRDHRGDVN